MGTELQRPSPIGTHQGKADIQDCGQHGRCDETPAGKRQSIPERRPWKRSWPALSKWPEESPL